MVGGASVNDLAVQKLLDKPVLLYEGEEALGAQQNRTYDVSALIVAQTRLTGRARLQACGLDRTVKGG